MKLAPLLFGLATLIFTAHRPPMPQRVSSRSSPPSRSLPTWPRTLRATPPSWNRSPSPERRSTTTSRRRATSCGRRMPSSILWNGLNLELWFEKFLRNLRDVPGVVVSEGVRADGHCQEGPYTGKPNPHAWMSPSDALIYVDNIRDALRQTRPGNAETYTGQCGGLQGEDPGHRRADPRRPWRRSPSSSAGW